MEFKGNSGTGWSVQLMIHRHGGDIYRYREAEDFSANINYRGMPDAVRAAAEAAIAQAVHYPDPDCRALREALAERENRLAGEKPDDAWKNKYTLWQEASSSGRELSDRMRRDKAGTGQITPQQILCGNGAAELMFALVAAYRPQRALLAVPSFFEYEQALSAFGCRVVRFRLKPEDNFRIGEEFVRAAELFLRGETFAEDTEAFPCVETPAGDTEGFPCVKTPARDMEAFPRGETFAENMGTFPHGGELTGVTEVFPRREEFRRILILGNPNNPTGRLIEADVLERLVSLCERSRALLVLDESFFDFLSEADRKRTFPGAGRILGNPYLFVIRSFTKIYAMPGLRFGYGLSGDAAFLSRMRELLQPWNVSVVAQAAAQAAAREIGFARETAEQTAEYRAQLASALAACGLRVFPSEANFLLLLGPKNLQSWCLLQKILIRDCGNFPGLSRPDDSGYFRVCVRSPEENDRLIRAIRQSVRETGQDRMVLHQEAEAIRKYGKSKDRSVQEDLRWRRRS